MKFPSKIKRKNNKKSNIAVGTLYDINKSIVEKNIKPLTKKELQNKKELIINYINQTNNKYYMLLCNDRKDYTVFHKNEITEEKLENILIDECLPNRGETKSIELTETKDAIEIWISTKWESYCYYFFPYDAAIIEC